MRSWRGRASAVTRRYPRVSLIAGIAYPEPKPVGEKRKENTPPVTKALPLRRSNTDCEAGMNHKASAAVSADLNRNTLSCPWVSGVQNSIALQSSAHCCSPITQVGK